MIPGLLCDPVDSAITARILAAMPERLSILESGVFLGSWCIWANVLKPGSEFWGIENMRFISNQYEFDWYRNFSPEFEQLIQSGVLAQTVQNPTTQNLAAVIQARCQEHTQTGINIQLSTDFVQDIRPDVIHHDCAWDYQTNQRFFDYYLDIMAEHTLLIVDNYGAEQPFRTAAVGNLIAQRRLTPVGFGRHKAYLSRSPVWAGAYTRNVLRQRFDFDVFHQPDSHAGKIVFYILPTQQYS